MKLVGKVRYFWMLKVGVMRFIFIRFFLFGSSTGCEFSLMWVDVLGRVKSLLYEWLFLVRERVWESCLVKVR